jgi:hypothetical protein
MKDVEDFFIHINQVMIRIQYVQWVSSINTCVQQNALTMCLTMMPSI